MKFTDKLFEKSVFTQEADGLSLMDHLFSWTSCVPQKGGVDMTVYMIWLWQ